MAKVESISGRLPLCPYCGSEERHPDYTCPRIRSVTCYPDGGAVEITFHEPVEYELEISADEDESE